MDLPLGGRPSSTHSMINRRRGRRSVKSQVKVSTNRTHPPVTHHRPPPAKSPDPELAERASISSEQSDLEGSSVGSSPMWHRTPTPLSEADLPPLDLNDVAEEEEVLEHHDMPKKRYRVSAFDAFLPHRKAFLEALFIHDGLGDDRKPQQCFKCGLELLTNGPSSPNFRKCLDCSHKPLFCLTCLVECHQLLPTHRIKVWDQDHWGCDELSRHNLIVHVGHGGKPCTSPSRAKPMTIVDNNGFHHALVSFCTCSADIEERLEYCQLLAAQLFPATIDSPATVFTFSVLDMLTILCERGKGSVYDFHETLRLLTDGCELESVTKRYTELNFAVRRYRHLLSLKRAGIAHSPHGIQDIRPGCLAIENPAAPLEGKNLPEEWRMKYQGKPHLSAQYIALDANFRHKRKARDGDGDSGFTRGAGYFVEPRLFAEELARVQDQPQASEKPTCESSFAAIERADSRVNKGFSVTGIVAAIDARHGFLLANGVVDLQKGERYFNTDLAFLSALQHITGEVLFVSYDIACQWTVNLHTRCEDFPPDLREALKDRRIRFVIPKFHLPAHGFRCWTIFSLNFITGSARVDGEGIERFWAISNSVATSTREMGKGSRHDFLEDRWGAANFRKLINLGISLSRKLRAAVQGKARHQKELEDFSSAFDLAIIEGWRRNIEEYHKDPSEHDDPYHVLSPEYTMADIQKELCAIEPTFSVGDDPPLCGEVDFLTVGIEIENMQKALHLEATSKTRPSKTDLAALAKRRETLGRRLLGWIDQQAKFMPPAVTYRISTRSEPLRSDDSNLGASDGNIAYDDDDHSDDDSENGDSDAAAALLGLNAEDVDLLLPSSRASLERNFATARMAEKERQLRVVRLESHLVELRRLLRIKASVYLDKKPNSVGQRAGTRSTTILSNYAAKIKHVAKLYREEREATLRLDPTGEWRNRLQKLNDSDIRPVHQNADEADFAFFDRASERRVWGEAQREISWIWKVPHLGGGRSREFSSDTEEQEEGLKALQVEWAKTYARANRFVEEVELTVEEMKRVQRYFGWRAAWWREREHQGRKEVSIIVSSGRRSYARKQARIIERLRQKFVGIWHSELRQLGMPSTEINDL